MIENRSKLASSAARDLALSCVEVGIEASDPVRALEASLEYADGVLTIDETSYDIDRFDEVIVVGGGKASGKQARALEGMLGDRIDRGLVVTAEPLDLTTIEVRVGDHPVPSERGVTATRELISLVKEAGERSLVIALITGGGSALLPAPAGDVTLGDLQTVTSAMLESGATIDEINAVRKHLSAIKGGSLARVAAPATVVGLLMSDVVGDNPSVIASGPTVPDETTFHDAHNVFVRYDLAVPASVSNHIGAGMRGNLPDTPDRDDPLFDHVTNHVTADGTTPIRASLDYLADQPYEALFLSSRIRGEAREAAKSIVAVGEEIQASGQPIDAPAVVLSGGETTVTITGDGQGGPNQEFALSAAIEKASGITVASVDTDGIDGASPAAGGIVDVDTVEDVNGASAALAANDAYSYLYERNGVIETGSTGTNVNDFRVMVVEPGH